MTGFHSKRAMRNNSTDRIYIDELVDDTVSDLIVDTGTVYGSKYHTVKMVGGNWPKMAEWSIETYGPAAKHIWGEREVPEPRQRWYMNNGKFWFRDEQDLILFILRWR